MTRRSMIFGLLSDIEGRCRLDCADTTERDPLTGGQLTYFARHNVTEAAPSSRSLRGWARYTELRTHPSQILRQVLT
jgi:hypothetical protein